MTTLAARPRSLTIGIVMLLVLQAAFLIQEMSAAAGSITRPPWVVAVNGGTMLLLLTAMLINPRHPRAAWILIALSLAGLVTSVIAVRQLGG